ncbi:MAG: GreA/GreB family elongation factor [Sphingomicrobium sp.]
MSVAFRRDCDEEHLEPKFELPIPPGPNLVTAHGYALIEARNAELEAMLATELGEDERKAVLRDARYWRHQLASAQLVPVPDGATVAIGTRVTIEGAGRTRTLDIVGHDESDPAASRIAFSAPLARALIGCAIGDEADLPGAANPVLVTMIEVSGPESGAQLP